MPETSQPIVQLIEGGGILYDAAWVSKPDTTLFTLSYWASRNALSLMPGGRGGVAFVNPAAAGLSSPPIAQTAPPAADTEWALRHYRRGGLAARVSGDRYLWLGARRTRSFSEWRLLLELRQMALPVPAPIAARYLRHGPWYTADLITERVPAATLAERMQAGSLSAESWSSVGRTIARFHSAGVQHADLNANNVLLGDAGCYLLDFDRGRIHRRRRTEFWQRQVLARLYRSLQKIHRQHPGTAFGEPQWTALLRGYQGR